MGGSSPGAAYARRNDTPHSPALGQSSSRSRRSSTSTGPRTSSSTTSSSSSRYSPAEPPQAEATGSVPTATRRQFHASPCQTRGQGQTTKDGQASLDVR